MIIYGALIFPIILAWILYRYYRKQTLWWEFAIPFGGTLIYIIIAKLMIEWISVRCEEYWGSMIKRIEYYEDWNEYIHRTCTRSCGKNCTTTYDCSYVDYHPAEWKVITTTDETIHIDEHEYKRLKKKFGNEQFIELNRSYYTNDGDEYYCQWNGDSAIGVPVTTMHYYENRIKAADQSVFHFRKVDTADVRQYQLKGYPPITGYYEMDAVMGDSCPDAFLANIKLKYVNGILGAKKQVRIFVLVFHNQPVEAALYQESYWSGANKNEFVVCIGVNKNRQVQWCHPFSWTTNEQLKVEVKSYVQNQKALSLRTLSRYLMINIDSKFVRRDFKEFDYLTVEPSATAVIIAYLLAIILNIGLWKWVVDNEYNDDNDGGDNSRGGTTKKRKGLIYRVKQFIYDNSSFNN